VLGAGTDARPVRTEPGDYRRFYSLCIPWLRDGAPPPVDPMDAIAVLNIIHAAQRSVSEARVVSLSLHS
jgi:scyllo-inositol 2-dehydrogenase (NADP+)